MDRQFIGVLLVALLLILANARHSLGAVDRGCGVSFKKVDYSAQFTWKGKLSNLSVGTAIENGKLRWLAQIASTRGGVQSCQAICEVQHLEVDRFRESAPVSLDMKCQSSGFAPLETKAVLLWASEIQQAPMLRFGTWLSGYQDAVLKVELDGFVKAMPSVVAHDKTLKMVAVK